MSSPKQVHVGILGYGIVGGGTAQTLIENAELIERRAGVPIVLRRVADVDLERERPYRVDPALLTRDGREIINDPEIHIVVETIGGVGVARTFILDAIAAGKCVVTSNKELMAKHGSEIMDAARDRGVDIQFEGSVGGGIPIIAPLKHGLAGNRILEIIGILNGTTNYILTAMAQDGSDFDAVLAEAQAKGYAEADPTADVDGIDAANKIAILAAIAFGERLAVDRVPREGIRNISARDMQCAAEMGYCIKLLAIARPHGDALDVRVHPALVPTGHPLSTVDGVYNAVLVEGNMVGRVMFYGRGAGAEPTGSAVVGDIIDCARNIVRSAAGRVPCSCIGHTNILDPGESESAFYMRMQVADRAGVLAATAGVFGRHQVSIRSLVQHDTDSELAEIVWVTHRTPLRALETALAEIRELEVVHEVSSVIRVEGDAPAC